MVLYNILMNGVCSLTLISLSQCFNLGLRNWLKHLFPPRDQYGNVDLLRTIF